jgi:hypothetical protein
LWPDVWEKVGQQPRFERDDQNAVKCANHAVDWLGSPSIEPLASQIQKQDCCPRSESLYLHHNRLNAGGHVRELGVPWSRKVGVQVVDRHLVDKQIRVVPVHSQDVADGPAIET